MRSGTPYRRITIRSFPGETAKVIGWVNITASYTTLSHLRIDGSNTFYRSQPKHTSCSTPVSQGLVIAGHDDILEYNDYYQSVPHLRGNGIGIGWWGNADNTVVRFNKIHDVGLCLAYDHLIYLAHGNNVHIYDNWMWNDPHGRGVQLYPGPNNARVWGNVVDRAGEGFMIGNVSGETVSGNLLWGNIVSNSTGLPWEGIPGQAIHDIYGGAPGTGNTFHDNVSFNNPGGFGRLTAVLAYANIITDPHFVNAAKHDYRVRRLR